MPRRRPDATIVLPYRGYGTPTKLKLSGRVLQDEGFQPALDGARRLRNFVEFVKRLESDEVPGARVKATFAGTSVDTASRWQAVHPSYVERFGPAAAVIGPPT